jgi:protein DGCR14
MSSQAVTKREAEQSLMPPPPPPKRIKRPAAVLDEDIYTNALSEIIARDFFPGLLETQIKQEYLEALESKDKAWIASSKKKLADVASGRVDGGRKAAVPGTGNGNITPQATATPRAGDTPTGWGGDTPMTAISTGSGSSTAPGGETGEQREPIPDVSNLGLLAFQAKYTSEDNESFNKLLDTQNAKRRDGYRWIWSGNKIPSARQIAHQRSEAKRITARGENPDDYLAQLEGESGDGDGEEQPEPEQEPEPGPGPAPAQTEAIKTDLDARPAKPVAWPNARPENPLMFLPSSVEDTHETIQQRAEAQSRAGPKRVLYQNTRLPDPASAAAAEANGEKVPPSPSISAIQDAIAGRPRLSASEAGSNVGPTTGGETPRVNGYSFVDDEPEPSTTTEDAAEDLRLLGRAPQTPNPFQLAEPRKREDLHHRMVDRVARKKRAEKAARVPTPMSTPPRFASSPGSLLHGSPAASSSAGAGAGGEKKTLTPAAQKLLHRVGGGTPRPKSGEEESSGLRNMWTPTPKRR